MNSPPLETPADSLPTMHPNPTRFVALKRLATLVGLGLALPLQTNPAVAAEQAAPIEDHAAEYKTLTADFARMDGLFIEYNDPVHKLTIVGYINLMKNRAELLGWQRPEGEPTGQIRGGGPGGGYETTMIDAKPQWDQVKYDELRYDINLQCQRLANWLAPLRTPPPTPRVEGGAQLSVAKLNPSPANPAEVKAALEALDREIKRLDDQTTAMVIGSTTRDSEVARIKRIKERRAALGKKFTKASWDTLVADLK